MTRAIHELLGDIVDEPSLSPAEVQSDGDGKPSGNVQSVERAMLLLLTLAESTEPRTLQQLTKRARCSSSSASRILTTMLKHRVVAQDPVTRKYRLGSQLVALANAQRESIDLQQVIAPHLRRLRDLTNETALLTIPAGTSAVCLAREESSDPLRFVVRTGQSEPIAALGATRRVLLAFMRPDLAVQVIRDAALLHEPARIDRLPEDMARIRATGFARTWGERVPASASMAAGLFDDSGELCGAISLAGPGDRLTSDAMDNCEAAVRSAAVGVSQELGFRGTYPPAAPADLREPLLTARS